MQWKIYYEDLTTFDSIQGSPWEAPRIGIQFIIQKTRRGTWAIWSGANFYTYDPDREGWWWAGDIDLVLHLQRAERPTVLFGSMIAESLWNEILKKVFDELPGNKDRWHKWKEHYQPWNLFEVGDHG